MADSILCQPMKKKSPAGALEANGTQRHLRNLKKRRRFLVALLPRFQARRIGPLQERMQDQRLPKAH
jgi:hypothetical protein